LVFPFPFFFFFLSITFYSCPTALSDKNEKEKRYKNYQNVLERFFALFYLHFTRGTMYLAANAATGLPHGTLGKSGPSAPAISI